MSNLHPIMAAALAPWTPRTPEEEAKFVEADLAEAAAKEDPCYEQIRADIIQRRDAMLVNAMAPRGLPGEPL